MAVVHLHAIEGVGERRAVDDYGYSQAADLRNNGVAWYATLGLGAAAVTLAATALGRHDPTRPPRQRRALTLAAGLTVGTCW